MPHKLKILYSNISMLDHPQGAFYRSYMLCQGLVSLGNQVTFITLQSKGYKFPYRKEIRDGLTIIAFPSILPYRFRKFGYGLISSLLKLCYILPQKYDVLHSDHYRPSSFFPCYIYKLVKGGLLVNEWMDFMGKGSYYDTKSPIWKITIGVIDNWLEFYSKKKSDAIIVLSEQLKQMSIKLGFSQNKILKLWGGSDNLGINYVSDPTTYRKYFGLPKNAILVSFVNMGVGDISDSLQALMAIRELFKNNKNIRGIRTGELLSKELRDKYKIGEELIELNSVPYADYGKLLSCANCFTLIQKENLRNATRWPNIIGDFFAAGRPTIVIPAADVIECVKQFPIAFKVVTNNIEDIKYAIENIVQQKYKEQCQKIRNISEENFSWFERSQELNDFYSKMIPR